MPCDLQVANENVPFWGKYSSYIKDFIMKLILPEYLEPVPVAVSWAAWSAACSSWISLVLPLASYSVPVLNIEGTFPSGFNSSAVAKNVKKMQTHADLHGVYRLSMCAKTSPRQKLPHPFPTPPPPQVEWNKTPWKFDAHVLRTRILKSNFYISKNFYKCKLTLP